MCSVNDLQTSCTLSFGFFNACKLIRAQPNSPRKIYHHLSSHHEERCWSYMATKTWQLHRSYCIWWQSFGLNIQLFQVQRFGARASTHHTHLHACAHTHTNTHTQYTYILTRSFFIEAPHDYRQRIIKY